MKSRLVLWGKNIEKDSVIFAYDLNPSDRKLTLFIFDFIHSNETFFQTLLNEWRKKETVVFPDTTATFSMNLAVTSLPIPEGYSVDNVELLEQANLDWEFVCLSNQLFVSYDSQLIDIESTVEDIQIFQPALWTTLLNLSNEVHKKASENILAWSHLRILKPRITKCFDRLKALKQDVGNPSLDQLKVEINQKIDQVISSKDTSAIPAILKEVNNSALSDQVKTGMKSRLHKIQIRSKSTNLNSDELQERLEKAQGAFERTTKKIKWLTKELSNLDTKLINSQNILQQQLFQTQKIMLQKEYDELIEKKDSIEKSLQKLSKKQGSPKDPK